MFNLKNTAWSFCLLFALSFTLALTSCSSDDTDDEPEDNCTAEFLSQNAQGSFMGDSYNVVQGTAEEDFADATQFRFNLYGEAVSGDACDGFNFDKPDSTIIFSVPMVVGVYELGTSYSLTFNDASVVNEVNAVIALCGAIEITEVTATTVAGKIDAIGDDTSTLNGNFTAVLCQ
ncbi:MAG: hypothetical protein ACI8YQ_000294 [Polaribacter sp.]|jgi:hypothetical protein